MQSGWYLTGRVVKREDFLTETTELHAEQVRWVTAEGVPAPRELALACEQMGLRKPISRMSRMGAHSSELIAPDRLYETAPGVEWAETVYVRERDWRQVTAEFVADASPAFWLNGAPYIESAPPAR